MTCRSSCCSPPVSPPLLCPVVGTGARMPGDDAEDVLGDDVPVDKKHVAIGEHIIGEDVLLDPDSGPGALQPIALPAPKGMTPAAWAKHCLTHLPYDANCPFCVACRRANSHHRTSHESERQIPLLVADYCIIKESSDTENITILVMRLYPYKNFLARSSRPFR